MNRPYKSYYTVLCALILSASHLLAIAQDQVYVTNKKWAHTASVGISLSNEHKAKGILSWQTMYGLNSRFSTGLETGYFFMDRNSPDLLPILALVGFKLSDKSVFPVIYGGIGHNFTIGEIDQPEWSSEHEVSGSWAVKMGITVPFKLNDQNQLTIGLHYYRFNFFRNYSQSTWWGSGIEYEEAHSKNRLAISFGLTF
ncbi:MAG TPA: hypothetical protein DDY13_16575 [Cytophagales bacterium]|nr:hypothetical protein [Cytophagales bacterium]